MAKPADPAPPRSIRRWVVGGVVGALALWGVTAIGAYSDGRGTLGGPRFTGEQAALLGLIPATIWLCMAAAGIVKRRSSFWPGASVPTRRERSAVAHVLDGRSAPDWLDRETAVQAQEYEVAASRLAFEVSLIAAGVPALGFLIWAYWKPLAVIPAVVLLAFPAWYALLWQRQRRRRARLEGVYPPP